MFIRAASSEQILKKTILNQAHKDMGAKMALFAGWEMPIHYPAGIFAEHRATRVAASLFDVTHMSIFEFFGPCAAAFLEGLLAGRAEGLAVGRAAYNCLLSPQGEAIDDVFLYRPEPERYLLVVNAANARADWDWIAAAQSGKPPVDPEDPARRLPSPVGVRDLREAGEDSLVLLAFQGPRSRDILAALADEEGRRIIGAMKRNDLRSARLMGKDVLLAGTGYTGEEKGFEIFLHPRDLPALWDALLETGKPHGVLAAGLGARDAARLEAGFPLFGHELEGEDRATLHEVGYGWVIKESKPWFVGKEAYFRRVARGRRKLVRLSGRGAKSAREGHRILYDDGRGAGAITSFAFLDEAKNFMVLALVDVDFPDEPGRSVRAARIKRDPIPGEDLSGRSVELILQSRFPGPEEGEEWKEKYGKT